MEVTVTIAGTDSVVRVPVGHTLLEVLDRLGIETDESCAGTGTCGECRIQLSGVPPEPGLEDRDLLTPDELRDGWRLGCQVPVTSDCTITLPDRENGGKLRIVSASRYDTDVELRKVPRTGHLGLAVDLGTTTIAAFLVDGSDGATVALDASPNPQRRFGADVIARIARAHQSPDELLRLRDEATGAIESLGSSMARETGADPRSVSDIVVVGNSTMIHLLWGVDPFPLATAPYDPVFGEPEPAPASALGLDLFRNALVRSLPGIGGHVGSDIVAGLLGLDLAPRPDPRLFLDLGTNGEIVLIVGDRALACSTAAGPAFEGVHISDGMPAVDGAVCEVDIVQGELVLKTIGDRPPVGLCGSGLVDALAALRRAGVIADNGRLSDSDARRLSAPMRARLAGGRDGRSVRIAESVRITQADVREIQLAVSAMRTGVEILLAEAGLSPSDVVHTYVGGGFGSSLRPRSLLDLGILPSGTGGIIEPVGNVAGRGARMAVANPDLVDAARDLVARVEHVRIEDQAGFAEAFVRNTGFPSIEQ